MAKGFAIAAFVFLLLSFPVPILGNYMTLGALALVTIAAACGDKAWTIAVTLISGIKLFFLSPSWHLAMFGGAYMQAINHAVLPSPYAGSATQNMMQSGASNMQAINHFVLLVTVAFLAAPIAALIIKQRQADRAPVDSSQFEIG
jgi:type IV secretory pathway VirB2 component (pilin)